MNQSVSWAGFSSGLVTFMGVGAEMIDKHTQWSDFRTPYGVLHIFILGIAFVIMIGGALGINFPRKPGTHSDRKDDPKPT